MIPLTSRSGAVDDAIQAPSLIGAAATTHMGRVELSQYGGDDVFPEGI